MKIIDDKGRMFGRFNIIDLLALIIIIVAAVMLVGKLMSNRDAVDPSMNLRYTVRVYHVEEEVYQAIQGVTLPDQLMASGDMLSGQVISVTAEPSKGEIYNLTPDEENGSIELITSGGPTYDLTFVIEAYVANTVTNEIGTQEIRIGKDHIVKTSNFELPDGVVLSYEMLDAGV